MLALVVDTQVTKDRSDGYFRVLVGVVDLGFVAFGKTDRGFVPVIAGMGVGAAVSQKFNH